MSSTKCEEKFSPGFLHMAFLIVLYHGYPVPFSTTCDNRSMLHFPNSNLLLSITSFFCISVTFPRWYRSYKLGHQMTLFTRAFPVARLTIPPPIAWHTTKCYSHAHCRPYRGTFMAIKTIQNTNYLKITILLYLLLQKLRHNHLTKQYSSTISL